MNDWVYVASGWAVAALMIGGYTVTVLLRGRSLSRRVPPGDRRWM